LNTTDQPDPAGRAAPCAVPRRRETSPAPWPPRCRASKAREQAFTLIEILLAATLGALLLIATATTAGMFGTQLKALDSEQDSSLEESLTAIADDIRYAWWAEVPNSTTLTLSDPQGESTTYFFRKDKLIVLRPNGTQGYVLEGLQGGSFSAETMARYREGTPAVRGGTFWSAALPGGSTPAATVLEDKCKLAIGFTLASPSPVGTSLVAGITEQLLNAAPTSISLPIAAISPVGGTVTVTLYRARAPNDARPEGAALGSFTLNPSSLPVATSYVWDSKKKKKVNVPNGPAWGWWKNKGHYSLVTTAPAANVTVDLGSLNATLVPGRAYTLQIAMSGTGGIAVATATTGTANNSGVAFDAAGAGMNEAALRVACSLVGNMSVTEAISNTVVNRVAITLQGGDGTTVTGSVTLTGQGMATDQWLGVVPGETES